MDRNEVEEKLPLPEKPYLQALTANGFTILKDSRNAQPESMAAALRLLGDYPGRHVAILGDMQELGMRTQAEHYRIGRIAAENAQIVLTFGPNGHRVINGAITGGMPTSKAMAFEDRNQLVATLQRLSKPGDAILFMGSHAMDMERILSQFLKVDTSVT